MTKNRAITVVLDSSVNVTVYIKRTSSKVPMSELHISDLDLSLNEKQLFRSANNVTYTWASSNGEIHRRYLKSRGCIKKRTFKIIKPRKFLG